MPPRHVAAITRDLAAIVPAEEPLSAEMLRQLLVERRALKSRMKLPTQEALEALATFLWAFRWLVSCWTADDQRQRLQDAQQAWIRYQAALAELDAMIPVLHAWFTPRYQLAGPLAALQRYKADGLEILATMVTAMRQQADSLEPTVPSKDIWHHVVVDLAAHVRTALRSTNPREPLASSNRGPVPSILSAVMPYVTGETVPVETVGKYLQRHEPGGQATGKSRSKPGR